jgi:Holliday junction resolvasome RuvABC endonuclease subunit
MALGTHRWSDTVSAPRIVGIDPSLTSTGVCLPDGSTRLVTTAKLTGPQRLIFIRDSITALLADVDLVVIEAVPTRGAMSIAPLAGLGAVLRVAFYEHDVSYVDVSPSTRAKFACGDQKGRDKDAVLARAIRAGSPANTNDEADAWWLWTLATAAYQHPEDLYTYQHQAITVISWTETVRTPEQDFTARQHNAAQVAAGAGQPETQPVTVPSGNLTRALRALIKGNEEAFLNILHPASVDVSVLYACLRSQTPLDLHPFEIGLADDGAHDLAFTDEYHANVAANFDATIDTEDNP